MVLGALRKPISVPDLTEAAIVPNDSSGSAESGQQLTMQREG